MNDYIVYGGLPDTAGGFLGIISGGDIEHIINSIDGDEIEENDADLVVDSNSAYDTDKINSGYDTDKINGGYGDSDTENDDSGSDDDLIVKTKDKPTGSTDDPKDDPADDSLIIDNTDTLGTLNVDGLIVDTDDKHSLSEIKEIDPNTSDNEDLFVTIKEVPAIKKSGGGNVLQLLASLIPSVFPKPYL